MRIKRTLVVGLLASLIAAAPAISGTATPSGNMLTADMSGTGRDDLVVDFGGASGVWIYSHGTGWRSAGMPDVESIVAGDLDGNGKADLIVDRGADGIHVYMNETLPWEKIHASNPDQLATGDLDGNGVDDLVVDFGAAGLWRRMNGGMWVQETAGNTTFVLVEDVDASGDAEIILTEPVGAPGERGLFIVMGTTFTWTRLHASIPEDVAAVDYDNDGLHDLAVDFGGAGLWLRKTPAMAGSWRQLPFLSPIWMETGFIHDDGEQDLLAFFGKPGLFASKTGELDRITSTAIEGMATGDLDDSGVDELIVDFGGGNGVWVLWNGTNWTKVHATSPG